MQLTDLKLFMTNWHSTTSSTMWGSSSTTVSSHVFTMQGRRNRSGSGRPCGCRINNLTNKYFCVHIMSTSQENYSKICDTRCHLAIISWQLWLREIVAG